MTDHMTPWGTYLVLEVSSAEPDADPDWVDLTDRVIDIGRDLSTWLGRDSELDEPEPGGASLQLRNRDDALTPGNPTSPYYPWWKQARRFRIREVVGNLAFELADGYLEIPEVQVRTQDPDETDSDVTLTVTAVDILGRLQNARRFTSTLTEYIRYTGSSKGLVAHWPMNEASLPFLPITGQDLPTRTKGYSLTWGDPTAQEGTAQIHPATIAGPPGDDISYAFYEMELHTVGGFLRPARTMLTQVDVPTGTLPIGTGERATVVFWVKSPWSAVDSEAIPMTIAWEVGGGGTGFLELKRQDGAEGTWLLEEVGSSGMTGSCEGPIAAYDRWTLIGIRWGDTPLALELWVDDQQIVDTPSGSVSGTTSEISTLFMPEGRFDGSIAHVQVYIGDEDAFTFDDFTAQRRVGLDGYDRQPTGDRVNTILDFAGWPSGRRDIDTGEAVMQPLSLAGKRPLDPIEEAVETEQGRLFAQAGRIQFHDRRRVHDV